MVDKSLLFYFMLDKKYFSNIRSVLLNYAEKRREIIKISGDAQQQSKKAIFALVRDDMTAAEGLLSQARIKLSEADEIIKSDERLSGEGSYKAALEEFVEADLVRQALDKDLLGEVTGMDVAADMYISGLCDVPGELYRYAIKCATEKKFERVTDCYEIAEQIITELVDMDLTGYNRQKFDQAKQALHKLEQVVYEVSLKRQ